MPVLDYLKYLKKSLLWSIGNAVVGLFPLLLSQVVLKLGGNTVGGEEFTHLLNDGVIVFFCISIMGSVLVDFVIEGYILKASTCFSIFIFPAIAILLVSINYVLLILNKIERTSFSISSLTSLFVILVAAFYSVFLKAALYINEDIKNKFIL